MELVRPFAKLGRNDAPLAGGKGASLGEMTSVGIPVPPGFVILADTFEKFLEETDLLAEIDSILHKVNHQEIHTVEAAAEQIKGLILAAKMPADIAAEIEREFGVLGAEYVAVRSSATAEDGAEHAWAGQLESYLNVTKDGVLEKVQHCWASLFTPRAIFYRFEKGLHGTKISVAVVVQKMVISEVSGIAFSVHPVTEDYNQLIIEAGFGLGEAIVSGQITPDSYVVEKSPLNILDINVATQTRGLYKKAGGGNEWVDIAEPKASTQVLTAEQILELSALILKIENHYGFPCDIEWAFAEGKFYIVQSRPITTLANKKNTTDSISTVGPNNLNAFLSVAQKKTWRKDWEGTFSILLTNISMTPYFHEFEQELGVNICNTITIHKNGLTSCFIAKEDEKVFGETLAQKVTVDQTLLDKWSGHAKDEYDQVFSIINNGIDQLLEKDNLANLIKHIRLFTAYLGAIKYVSNFLDKNIIDTRGQSMFEARLYTEKIFPALEKVFSNLAVLIGTRTNYASDLVLAMTAEELIDYANDKKIPDENKLEERRVASAYLYQKDVKEITGQTIIDLEKMLYGEHTDLLTGTGVYPGKATGRVKIILEFGKEKDKFNDGDVLVTGMTDPNFVPLMKKAKAIVTDAGGVLSHAAIVSRELGVPCVIGTEKATRILKDGDEVEVDADNGVVRIIK